MGHVGPKSSAPIGRHTTGSCGSRSWHRWPWRRPLNRASTSPSTPAPRHRPQAGGRPGSPDHREASLPPFRAQDVADTRGGECRRICRVNSYQDGTWQAQLHGSLPGKTRECIRRTTATRAALRRSSGTGDMPRTGYGQTSDVMTCSERSASIGSAASALQTVRPPPRRSPATLTDRRSPAAESTAVPENRRAQRMRKAQVQ